MIVSENYTGSPIRYHVGKNFAGMHLTFIQQPNGYDSIFNNLIGAIERYADKMLLRLACLSLGAATIASA